MDDSILTNIKKLIGYDADFTVYDTDMIIFINGCFSTLYQLGVGPIDAAFKITGANETWADFIQDNENIESVKTYIYLKTRLIFDPPTNSFVTTAITDQIKELEWRLNVECDPGWKEEPTNNNEEDSNG